MQRQSSMAHVQRKNQEGFVLLEGFGWISIERLKLLLRTLSRFCNHFDWFVQNYRNGNLTFQNSNNSNSNNNAFRRAWFFDPRPYIYMAEQSHQSIVCWIRGLNSLGLTQALGRQFCNIVAHLQTVSLLFSLITLERVEQLLRGNFEILQEMFDLALTPEFINHMSHISPQLAAVFVAMVLLFKIICVYLFTQNNNETALNNLRRLGNRLIGQSASFFETIRTIYFAFVDLLRQQLDNSVTEIRTIVSNMARFISNVFFRNNPSGTPRELLLAIRYLG